MRILFAEDDTSLGAAVKLGLEQDGFEVDWVTEGGAADQAIVARPYDVAVLDLGLPGIDGETLLQSWRARADRTPIVVLTARSLVPDRVRLLNLGADDYLTKPFDLIELCARIRAVFRRSAAQNSMVLAYGPLKLYLQSQTAYWHGRPVDVTNREFWLLEALVRFRGRVLARRELEAILYGHGEAVDSNTVEVHVHHLRRKFTRRLILTQRGRGYRLADELHAL
jgi:DNA-binding response OmpR family regulator